MGRSDVFRATVSDEKGPRQVLRGVLERVFDGSPKRPMIALPGDEAMTPEIMDEIQNLLSKAKQRGDADRDHDR